MVLAGVVSGGAQFPEYGTNPFVFEIAEMPYGDGYWWPAWGDDFLVADVDGDGLPDYLFRSETHLYAYKHDGTPMGGEYPLAIKSPNRNGGAKFGIAEVNGQIMLVAIDAEDTSNPIHIFSAATGVFQYKYPVPDLGTNQKVGHIVVANLQGKGDSDVVVQTVDIEQEGSRYYYINRSIIAMDLITGVVLWRHNQNRSSPPLYEGYWGVAHGPLMVADVDFDGRDEVVGGSFVGHNGTLNNLGFQNYESNWVDESPSYVDHLDAVSVGDFDPSKKGLEWVVPQEDNYNKLSNLNYKDPTYYTIMFSWESMQVEWQQRPSSLMGSTDFIAVNDYEPQNVAIGNFDSGRSGREIWNRSRMGRYNNPDISQHPWVYDISGDLIAHYRMADVLPAGFNSIDPLNNEGLEMIWTIDWEGGEKDYIAAKARHVKGNVGVFDAMTGSSVWHTGSDAGASYPPVQAHMIYVANVAGDWREEIIVCDVSTTPPRILVFQNDAANPHPPKQTQWEDPLYRRLKHNWNYYSPGSYTRPAPVRLDLRVFLEGPYLAASGTMRTVLCDSNWMPAQSPFEEDPVEVGSIPDSVVDWVLIQLRKEAAGDAVISQSAFLRDDGRVIDLDGSDAGVPLHVFRGTYHVVVKHRNHLAVMSAAPVRVAADSTTVYDFTDSVSKYYGERARLLAAGVYGLYTGDANRDGQVKVDDKNDYWWIQVGRAGYRSGDFNLDGQVKVDDKNDFWWKNVGIGSQVP